MTTLTLILIAVAVLATAADWRQTLRIFAPGSRWREINPAINALVRRLGAPAGVHVWFVLVIIGVGLALALLAPGPRLVAAALAAACEVYWVAHNLRLGIPVIR